MANGHGEYLHWVRAYLAMYTEGIPSVPPDQKRRVSCLRADALQNGLETLYGVSQPRAACQALVIENVLA
jgi:hypothetical protein